LYDNENKEEPMDLTRMLEKCRRDQWHVNDLDWSVKPRPMTEHEERSVVQYFTDMASIELLAGALFEEQAKRTDDLTLRAIFETFVVDEQRHSEAARRLARHYDVHHYQSYRTNPSLVAFKPHFANAIQYLSAEVANYYIVAGELILDVALLRSLNDYVADEMSQAAMNLINRDESRHIAMDFYMAEHYANEARAGRLERGRVPPTVQAKALWAIGNVLYYGRPFFDEVFFGPMRLVDPSGKRLREAYKRIQLLHDHEGIAERPFVRFMTTLRRLYDHPSTRRWLGPVAVRLAGVDTSVMGTVYTRDDLERSRRMSFEELAEDAVGVKYAS